MANKEKNFKKAPNIKGFKAKLSFKSCWVKPMIVNRFNCGA